MRMRSRPRPTAVTETMVPAARDISQSHGYDSNSSVLHRSWYISALNLRCWSRKKKHYFIHRPESFTYAILDDIILGCLKLGFQCVNFLKCPTMIFVTFLKLYLRPHNGLYFSTIRLELTLITLKG